MASIISKADFAEFQSGVFAAKLNTELVGWARLWNFKLGKSILLPGHESILFDCAQLLKEDSSFYARIIGLASRSGSDAFNQMLSDRRCRNVHGHLVVRRSVDVDQLTHKSGSLFLAMGEGAWQAMGVADGKKSENERHRAVIVQIWKTNNPTLVQQMNVLKLLLKGDA